MTISARGPRTCSGAIIVLSLETASNTDFISILAADREHGGSWRWLLRGLGPTLARGFVINAVNFVAFEWVLENVL